MNKKLILPVAVMTVISSLLFAPACGNGENTVNGVPLANYKIVYAEGDGVNRQLAEDLAAGIKSSCGVSVGVKSDAEKDGGNEIFVGKTNRNPEPEKAGYGKYCISTAGDSVSLYSGEISGTVGAAEKLIESVKQRKANYKKALKESYTDRSLKVMSFNIRTTAEDRWDRIKNVIERNDPDVLGTQEVSWYWQPYLKEQLEGYTCIGVGRDGGDPHGRFGDEAVYILYKTDKFELVEQNTYWYNEADITKFGITQGGMYPRIFTYAILKRKSDGEKFLYINTHMHLHVECRVIAAGILKQFISEKGENLPVYVTGDFNTEWDQTNNKVIVPGEHADIDTELESAGFVNARKSAVYTDDHHTFPSKLYPADATRWDKYIIDYCMYRGSAEYGVLAETYRVDGEEPDGAKAIIDSDGNPCGPDASDHYPVIVESVFYKKF